MGVNPKIAKMTGLGFATIALPIIVFTGTVLYFFLRKMSDLTGLKIDEIMKS